MDPVVLKNFAKDSEEKPKDDKKVVPARNAKVHTKRKKTWLQGK